MSMEERVEESVDKAASTIGAVALGGLGFSKSFIVKAIIKIAAAAGTDVLALLYEAIKNYLTGLQAPDEPEEGVTDDSTPPIESGK